MEKWKLSNNISCLAYQVPYETDKACLSLVINVGSLYDETQKGISHYLEHMLIMAVENISKLNGNLSISGYTDFEYTVYRIECINSSIESIRTSLSILVNILTGEALTPKNMEKARADILEEYNCFQRKNDIFPLIKNLTSDRLLLSFLPIGYSDVIKTISFEDILKHHLKWYSKEAVAVSIISAYDNTEIRFLISSEFEKSEKSLHTSFNNTEMNHDFSSIRLLLQEDAKNFNIYVKISSSLNNSMKNRILEDFGFIVIENYLEKYFRDCCKIEVDVQTTKTRYSKRYRFFCIKIRSLSDEIDVWLKNHKDIVPALFYEYIIENFYKSDFDSYKTAYVQNLLIAKEINIFMLDDEVKNYFVFGDPIYEKNDYLTQLKNVKYEEILILLKKWFLCL